MSSGFLGTENISSGGVVEWGDYRMATGEAVLCTYGIACCIGIALYDPLTKNGFLAHVYATEESHAETAIPMVEAATSIASDRSKLQAWVRGGILDPRQDSQQYEIDLGLRDKTVNLLTRVGIATSRSSILWNDNVRGSVDMTLHCSTGTLIDGITVYGSLSELSNQREDMMPSRLNEGFTRDLHNPYLERIPREASSVEY